MNKVIEKFSSSFKDYLRAEGPRHFGRQLTRQELDVIQNLKVVSRDQGFAIEVEDIGEAFNNFIYSRSTPTALPCFMGVSINDYDRHTYACRIGSFTYAR